MAFQQQPQQPQYGQVQPIQQSTQYPHQQGSPQQVPPQQTQQMGQQPLQQIPSQQPGQQWGAQQSTLAQPQLGHQTPQAMQQWGAQQPTLAQPQLGQQQSPQPGQQWGGQQPSLAQFQPGQQQVTQPGQQWGAQQRGFQPTQQPGQQFAQPMAQSGPQTISQQPAQQSMQYPFQQQGSLPQSQAQQPSLAQPTQQLGQAQPGQQLGQQQLLPATSPYVDIFDSPEEIVVFVDLPGAKKENISLEGDERTLRIIATREAEEEEGEELTPIQRERLRRAERTIQLPSDVDIEEAEATCEEGVCTVRLPKSSRRTIGVQ